MNHQQNSHHWKFWAGSLILLLLFVIGSANCVVGGNTGAEEPTGQTDGGGTVDSTGTTDTVADKQVSVETAPESTPEVASEPVVEATPEPVEEASPTPKVVTTTPKDGESLQQPPGQPIRITVIFDQDMDVSTFNQSGITIKPSMTGKVGAGADDKTFIFIPDQDLTAPQTFEVTINTSVLSKAGVALAQPFTFSFSTVLKPGPEYLGAFSCAGGSQTGDVTHHSVMGHNTVTGTTDGQGSHTVQHGFVYSFTQ